MIKTVSVELPVHLKKFFMYEYSGQIKKNEVGEIVVKKHSELGKLMHLLSRPIPFYQPLKKLSGSTVLNIRYSCRIQALEVDVEKIPELVGYMDEMFRRALIYEVRGGHELSGGDYGPLVTTFLKRRGIERDIDVDYQTMRKVYRDYIIKLKRDQQKFYQKISAQKVTQMQEK